MQCKEISYFISSQYTEQILPILLFAQRRLKDRISYYGPLIRNQSELITICCCYVMYTYLCSHSPGSSSGPRPYWSQYLW